MLLRSDPLADIGAMRDVLPVVENGALLDRGALDALVRQAMEVGEAMALPAPPR